MAMAGLADIQSFNWGCTVMGPRGATGWQPPPDPTGKQTVQEDQVAVPLAL